ncbi:MAG: pseudouridine-5-phosphate glycosidase [Candidatus Cloacimonas sp. SDB]|nr:MAG: pseudouridine-5-phosphate glycosidase [Candidatus Cloacimonas sp. SDB]
MEDQIRYSLEVEKALAEKKPVLALESTIISHGMPYPENLQVAEELEKIATENGVVPATVCLMDGFIKIGLNKSDLLRLAREKGVRKVSRRDVASVLVKKEMGATTVAATMMLSELAGIKVFATGGIGGVHRGLETRFDISADLLEFTRTPVVVVSAGAKAILDLKGTLEYLETMSVPVLGFKTSTFPAFYSRDSGIRISQIETEKEIVEIYKQNLRLGFRTGILVANPVPEKDEIPFQEMNKFIETALLAAEEQGITGQAVTPFLLRKIVEISQGRSLKANIALVKNNVALGSRIAKAF